MAAAAPRYPILSAQQLSATPRPTQPTLPGTAAALAHNDLVAQLKAITDQQAADRAAGRATADQILQASQGGADFLRRSGLAGDVQARDYARAVAETKSLAGGYSGQLRTDALNAATAAGTALHAIPGNAQPVTADRGGSLANLLYGLQGALPGQALAAQGLGSVAAARGAIPSALASGQLQALGAVQAANQQAARLDPQIAAAEGKLPAMTQSYLTSLTKAQTDAAKAQADVTYKAAYLKHLQNGDSERVSHDKAMEAAGVAYQQAQIALGQGRLSVSRFNATTSRINANKPSSSGGFTIGNTRYNADGTVLVRGKGSGTSSGGLSVSGYNSALGTARSSIVTGAKGQGGSVVQAPAGTAPDAQIQDAQGQPTGFVVSPTAGVVPYQQARANALAAIPAGANPKRWAADVQRTLDANYPPGQNGRYWEGAAARSHGLQGARVALQNGKSAADAYAGLVANLIPPAVARDAVAKVYAPKVRRAQAPVGVRGPRGSLVPPGLGGVVTGA